jgi:acyl-coenzyme A thioesterase PaaI-like protein
MKTNTKSDTRDDLMGMTIAVLMFVLQGCMVLAMSTDHLVAAKLTAVHGAVIAAHADSAGSGNLT